MKNELVFTKKEEVWTTSQCIAEKTETAHKNILQLIDKVYLSLMADKSAIKFVPKIIKSTFINKKGREFPVYYLNRPAFTLLMMRMHSKRAFEWQLKFNDAFYQMESALKNKQNASWIETRNNSIDQRIETTDIIKKFVEYATSQGSNKPMFYYKHFTDATYKALELIDENHTTPIRDMLNSMQLSFLMVAETIVQKCLEDGMENELHYKEIYLIAKQKLQEFHNSINIKTIPKEQTEKLND